MTNDSRVDTCPACGAHSVQSCVDGDGNERPDHPERTTLLPDWLGVVKPEVSR